MQTTGYYPRRRGVLEHLRDGRMSLLDLAFHDLLCQLADPGTGIARRSGAADLHHEFSISRKLAQKYLCRLEHKGYIKRFRKPRSKAPQITLIHRYECTDLPQKGLVLNAFVSVDWRECVYEPVSRAVSRAVSTAVPVHMGEFKNLRSKETTAQNPRGTPLPLGKDEGEHLRRQQAKQRRQQLETIGIPRTQQDRARGKENAIEVRRRAEANAIDDAIARERAANVATEPAEKTAEVSTAAASAPQNAPPASAPPVTRARDIQIGELKANESVSTADAPQGLDVDTRARAMAAAAGEGRELSWDEARELHLLKAKLRSLGNAQQNTT